MEEKQIIKININEAIALCHMLDEFDDFSKNLNNFLKKVKDKIKLIYKLGKISRGEFCTPSIKVRKFYNANKHAIDTINEYSHIHTFICQNFQFGYGKGDIEYKNYRLYQYILINQDKLDKILAVLEKLKELGFYSIEFDENQDFTNEHYTLDLSYHYRSYITYLDNLVAISSYQRDVVKYKSEGSSYKMLLETLDSSGNLNQIRMKILLNDLTFDISRLPKTISKEEIIDKIVGLQKDKNEEYTTIRNSVDLNIAIEDLLLMFHFVDSKISSLDGISQREELTKLLSNIKENILKMQAISTEYDKDAVSSNENITENLLKEEKKSYQRRRELSRLHID